MRFGLFGGARTETGEQASDSRIYTRLHRLHLRGRGARAFTASFLVEHHFTGFGQVSATLNFLTYLAAQDRRRCGSAPPSLVLPWHNPALLAEQAATLDLLSNGRLRFRRRQGLPLGRVPRLLHPDERGRGALSGDARAFCARPGPATAASRITASTGITRMS